MKLVRIEHTSCGDYDGATYMWADGARSVDGVQADVDRAIAAYRAAAAAVKPYNGLKWSDWNMAAWPQNAPDGMTAGEWRAKAEEAKAEYDAWRAAVDRGTRPFGAFMADLGYLQFNDFGPDIDVSANWGHHHGSHVDQSLNEPGDMPGPLVRETVEDRSTPGVVREYTVAKVIER